MLLILLRKTIKIILIFLFIFIFENCASYGNHRRRDFQDIVNIGLETPAYGIGVRIGPIPLGFYFEGGESSMGKKDLGTGMGLRGGEWGKYHTQQLVIGFLGGEKFHSGDPIVEDGEVQVDMHGIPLVENPRANTKSFKMRYFSYFQDPVIERQRRKKEEFRRRYLEDLIQKTGRDELKNYIPERDPKPFGYPSQFLWQVEIFVGLYGGVRAGLNLAEALDFLLGWVGIDILKDDIDF